MKEEDDIELLLQNLSNNLYSRFVTVTADEVRRLEQNLSMEVRKFNSDFEANLNALEKIEEGFIKRLAGIVELPEGLYRMEDLE